MLADIKKYLQDKDRANLSDLALHFRCSPDAMRGMLDVWVRKGKVIRHEAGMACGDCHTCDTSLAEIYEWDDGSSRITTISSPALESIKVVLHPED